MAEELKIKVTADAQEAKALKVELKELTQTIKAVELGFKSGELTQKQAQDRFMSLADKIKATGARELDLVDITQRLWHANNRVEIGFKSAATTWTNANKALRELNQEQKLGNAMLGKLSGSVSGLSSVLGRDFSGSIGQAIGLFQGFEDTLGVAAVGLKTVGGSAASAGAMLATVAAPIAIIAAAVGGFSMLVGGLNDETKENQKQISILKGEYEGLAGAAKLLEDAQAFKASWWKETAAGIFDYAESIGLAGGILGKAAKEAIESERELLKLKAGKADEAAVTKSLQDQLKTEQLKFEIGKSSAKQVEWQFLLLKQNAKTELEKLEINKQLLAFQKSQTKEAGSQSKELKAQELTLLQMIRLRDFVPSDRAAGVSRMQPRGLGGRNLGSAIAGSAQKPLSMVDVIKGELGEAEQEINTFENLAMGSFQNVGSTAARTIGQGFVDAFGIGHTLLGQFVNDFISQISSLAASGLIRGLFSLIGGGGFIGGFLGAFGIGGSSAPSAPAGSSSFSGGTQQMGSLLNPKRSSGATPTIVINGNFGYDRLAFAVQQGERVLSKRTF